MTYDYKEATSNLVLTLFLYILGLLTGPQGMYRELRAPSSPLGLIPVAEAVRLSRGCLVAVFHQGFDPISVTYPRAFYTKFYGLLKISYSSNINVN